MCNNNCEDCNNCQDCINCEDCCNDCLENQSSNCEEPIYTSENCPTGSISSDCSFYNGPDDPCLTLTKPITLTSFFAKLISFIKTKINSLSSDSLDITNDSLGCSNSRKIEIVPSSDANNIFILGSDGKPFVPQYSGNIPQVVIADGECISFDVQVVGNITTYTPVIDYNCLASNICGLCNLQLCQKPANLVAIPS